MPMSPLGQNRPKRAGRSLPPLPLISDINLLGNGQGVVHLDTQIPNYALDSPVTQKQLQGSQQCPISSSARV
jgi:hypothetical protein